MAVPDCGQNPKVMIPKDIFRELLPIGPIDRLFPTTHAVGGRHKVTQWVSHSIPSFLTLYRNALNVIPSSRAAAVLL